MPEYTFALQRRLAVSTPRAVLTFTGGLLVGIVLGLLLLMAVGVPAQALFDDLVVQVFLRQQGLAQTLTLSVPLVLAGLASAVAMRLKFWNIGIEGQLWLGAIGATAVALHGFGPPVLRLPLMLLAAALCGAAWIALPLLLRLRLQVSELVVTLLMSNIAYLLLQHLLFGAWRDPANSFPVSPRIGPEGRLALLGMGNLHSGIVVALLAALLVAALLERSRAGFHANAIGANAQVARAAGIPVTATLAGMVLLSGALAGLAGGIIVSGTEYRLTQNIGWNMTFSGIVVAFIARLKPLWVVPVAFVLGGLYNAGGTLKVFYGLSEAVVLLLQGVILMSLLVCLFFAHFRIDARKEPA
ncbi:ABC transporter permease [Corticibacter populi]|uniref:ABC transporter permease n=1 Tax=Corticibacter populi TaxID=1550736 RepID=A0A3M6QQU0_9BURK|nr:ABC transporter permease [Corticibacter populi]RMX04929.1 ABC transporter permease [Corticibacter populi]RZS33646.1 nucleoside ABC transporter membrane protein [Corticibacter populi]